jgi:hypothetical protein
MTEKPTMETPTTETQAPASPAATNQYAELVSELERFGVKNAEQLQGKLLASQEAGNLARQLGESRKEIAEMRQFMEQMNKPSHRPAVVKDDWGDPAQQQQSAGTIDLADLVGKQVKKVIDEEKRQAAHQQQAAYAAWNKITGDKDFHIVKDKWEAKLKDPNFALQFQSGQVDPYAEYQELLRDTYKSAVAKSAEIIKSLTTGAGPPKVHVEGQARVSGMETGKNTSDKDSIINPLREKVNKGKPLSEQEELAALMKVLGGGG